MMVAYSFKKRFADPIQRGDKRQTIRAHRKRPARDVFRGVLVKWRGG